tara:strand:+ start:1174 stop:1977 length:804 start_codon:yes stop_codon:yes gene_type:complete
MARYSRGRRALAISDRSGAAFPYKEMVKEWTGAWVHISEFEPKQPQLQPHPVGADPQALQHARPARTEFPVEDILPNDPFTTTAASKTLSVSFPNNDYNLGTTIVRFREVKVPVGGVAVSTLELETTLNGNVNATVTTITLTDASEFPTSGFILIEKMNSETGAFENETIQYTGKTGNNLTGCTRGTSAPYRGVTPTPTKAGTHTSGAKVFGSYTATAISNTVVVGPQPTQTETQHNSLTVQLVSNATSTATGGGFQCTIGPINDRG